MSQRVAKVQKVAKEILGEAIQDLKDPRIGFATVTAVRVSADLRHARVYVSVMGSEEEKVETLRGLESARSILRGELGRQSRPGDLKNHLRKGEESGEGKEDAKKGLRHEQRGGVDPRADRRAGVAPADRRRQG
jgi:ribosome-binding factor A